MSQSTLSNITLISPTIDVTTDPGISLVKSGQPVMDIDNSQGSIDFVNTSGQQLQYSFDGPVASPHFQGGKFVGNGAELVGITPSSIVGGLTGTFCGLRFQNGILIEEVAP